MPRVSKKAVYFGKMQVLFGKTKKPPSLEASKSLKTVLNMVGRGRLERPTNGLKIHCSTN